jgi:predicted permease
MNAFMKRVWPPTKTRKVSILWAFVFGFVLQIALPVLLGALGAKEAALFAIYPGLLPILWATGGWFAGIAPLGYVLMFSVNTVVYAALLLAGFRTCACLQRQYE